jgi:restriction system protein
MPKGKASLTIVPPYEALLWPTLLALTRLGGSGTIQEIYDTAIDVAELTDAQLQVVHGDGPQTEAGYRLAWARSYLKAVGALDNTARGVWAITELGRGLSKTDMAAIPARVRAMSLPRKPRRRASGVERNATDAPAAQEHSQLKPESFTSTSPDAWKDYLLSALLEMPPANFERLCQRVLRESGFTKVDVTGKSGDGGIDGIGVLRVSLLSFHVFFQCKRYRGSVGASAIRDFRGAMVGRTDKGLLITTGTFTPDAKREATRDGAPVLDLIDGDAFCMILKELALGVQTELVEAVTVDAGWFRALANHDASTAVQAPDHPPSI